MGSLTISSHVRPFVGLLIGLLARQTVIISLMGGQLHFHDPILELVTIMHYVFFMFVRCF